MTPGSVLVFQSQALGSGVQTAKVRQICRQLESGRASCPVKDEHLARSPLGVWHIPRVTHAICRADADCLWTAGLATTREAECA